VRALPRGADQTANTARDPASAADFDEEDRTCLM
jgi:hypothetical protein